MSLLFAFPAPSARRKLLQFLKIAGIYRYRLLYGLTLNVGFVSVGVNGALYPPERSHEIIEKEALVREHS